MEQALAVLDFALVAPTGTTPKELLNEEGLRIEQLATCAYFETERITLPKGHAFYGLCDGSTFEIWAVLAGSVTVDWDGEPLVLDAIRWVLLPAELGEYQVIAEEKSTLLRVVVPETAE
ncbi:MAG: hypothetical protein R2932_35470 [Caldilineaceae bacterium]